RPSRWNVGIRCQDLRCVGIIYVGTPLETSPGDTGPDRRERFLHSVLVLPLQRIQANLPQSRYSRLKTR
ncbi:unnamed protein product, partial [Mycena citricolor]